MKILALAALPLVGPYGGRCREEGVWVWRNLGNEVTSNNVFLKKNQRWLVIAGFQHSRVRQQKML